MLLAVFSFLLQSDISFVYCIRLYNPFLAKKETHNRAIRRPKPFTPRNFNLSATGIARRCLFRVAYLSGLCHGPEQYMSSSEPAPDQGLVSLSEKEYKCTLGLT